MGKPRESWDDALLRWLMKTSGRTAAAVGLAGYPVIGLVVPLLLGVPLVTLIGLNVLGVSWAAVVGLGWLAGQVQRRDRRHLVEWTTSLRLLGADEFEWLVGEVFRREGWRVTETGRLGAADGNIDLELTKPGGERRIVQCKRLTAKQVGVSDVREFGGTLMREHLPGASGIFVTLSDFTDDARAEALRSDIGLIDSVELHRRVEAIRRAEPCPICNEPMVLGRSTRGWWLRCVARGCAGKRDLSGDPARAVELLLESS
jgi:restriction system protein